jgi:hypothetical protein
VAGHRTIWENIRGPSTKNKWSKNWPWLDFDFDIPGERTMSPSLPLDSGQMTSFLIVSTIFGSAVLISIPAIIATAWTNVVTRRADAALKSEMLARGMSASEIVEVVNAGKEAQCGTKVVGDSSSLTTACEAVVDRHGEWTSALVLQVAEGGYLVHYIGETMDENEWVDPSRIRFAIGSPLNGASGPNAIPRKPPMMAEV